MTAGTLSTGIFREQSIDRLLEFLPTQILVADHASGVKDMDRRVITHVSMSNDTPHPCHSTNGSQGQASCCSFTRTGDPTWFRDGEEPQEALGR